MTGQLTAIKIYGIHGKKERKIEASIRNNTLILVGENGSGKTTFLRIIFHLLSGRWLMLLQFRFEFIVAVIDGQTFRITHAELNRGSEVLDREIIEHLPLGYRKRIKDLMKSGRRDRVVFELKKLGIRMPFPSDLFIHRPELFNDGDLLALNPETIEKIQKIRKLLSSQILYLPTFRRIERELGSIFEGLDVDELKRTQAQNRNKDSEDACIELVEFGMRDVQNAVDRVRDGIKEFARESLNKLTLNYLGDVVNEEYNKVGPQQIADASEETVQAVLGRIDEAILSRSHKEHLFTAINSARSASEPSEHHKIICHYFLKLRGFQEELQEKEEAISAFCALCSEYIRDKRFQYDRASFQFGIYAKDGHDQSTKIDLSELSSGEKQIVSLFSHLYLSGKSKYFVLIDEPELSLSVPWQQRFLSDIRKGAFCSGLIAVTHSPFIYDNDLREYTHSLCEFTQF